MAKLFLSPWSSVIKAGPVVNLNFFHELFTPVITEEENHMLTALPTEDEVYEIVSTLNPWKVPGQDGFNGKFYSSCWTIIRDEFFGGTLHRREINATLIIPIPNCASALFVHEFRPISLRSEIYKIISKPMVSQMKLVMQKCISEEQAACIQAKQIVDSVTLVSECFEMITNMRGETKCCALKLDIENAFDREEWNYLIKIFHCLGF